MFEFEKRILIGWQANTLRTSQLERVPDRQTFFYGRVDNLYYVKYMPGHYITNLTATVVLIKINEAQIANSSIYYCEYYIKIRL